MEDLLKKKTEKRFQHLIGKRCECYDKDGQRHVGVLEFAGTNEFFGWQQVTLNRTPVRHAKLETLKEYKQY